jgi:hypothetical protein
MPFRQTAQLTLTNLSEEDITCYYQVDYTLTAIPNDVAYLHTEWRRSNPLPYKQVHTVLNGVKGKGQYVGTYLAWQVNNSGWPLPQPAALRYVPLAYYGPNPL